MDADLESSTSHQSLDDTVSVDNDIDSFYCLNGARRLQPVVVGRRVTMPCGRVDCPLEASAAQPSTSAAVDIDPDECRICLESVPSAMMVAGCERCPQLSCVWCLLQTVTHIANDQFVDLGFRCNFCRSELQPSMLIYLHDLLDNHRQEPSFGVANTTTALERLHALVNPTTNGSSLSHISLNHSRGVLTFHPRRSNRSRRRNRARRGNRTANQHQQSNRGLANQRRGGSRAPNQQQLSNRSLPNHRRGGGANRGNSRRGAADVSEVALATANQRRRPIDRAPISKRKQLPRYCPLQ